MTKFLYFIPGRQSAVDKAKIESVGLNYALDSAGGRGVLRGPEDGPGTILCDDSSIIGYYPDKQTWRPGPREADGDAPYWIGFETDNPPTPESLARPTQLGGPLVRFFNGGQWRVPVLRQWEAGDEPGQALWSTTLPSMIDIDAYGIPIEGNVVPQYRDLFDVGLQVLAKMVGGESSLSNSQLIQFAADCLGANYRVSLLELTALECLCTDDARKVIEAAIDLSGYEEAVKNSAGRQDRPDTDSDSGSEPSTRASNTGTDQALAS